VRYKFEREAETKAVLEEIQFTSFYWIPMDQGRVIWRALAKHGNESQGSLRGGHVLL
jgi:hypothetical protein